MKPGKTKAIQYFINTTENDLIRQPSYHLPHAYWEEVKQEVKDMLAEGLIESDWASPIVFVRKKMVLCACMWIRGS